MMYNGLDSPHFHMEPDTIVMDPSVQRHVMWLKGHVVLPPGSYIELFDPEKTVHGSALVTRVRLLSATGPEAQTEDDTKFAGAQICLDVQVAPGWWEAHPVS